MRWFFSSETNSPLMRTVLETQLLGNNQPVNLFSLPTTQTHRDHLPPGIRREWSGRLVLRRRADQTVWLCRCKVLLCLSKLIFVFLYFLSPFFYHARFHWPACLPSQDADYTGDMGWMYGETLPIHFWAVPSTDPCQSLQQ